LDVDAVGLAGRWWRQIPAGGDPLYRPPHPADNRWQRGSVVEALYFADSEETMWAEWYRWLGDAGLPPRQGLPRDVWRWRISLPEVADLGDDARLARVGLPPVHPTRHQWPGFQAVGEQLFSAGWRALVAPSAARREGRVLCVFRTSHRVAGIRRVGRPARVDEAPTVPTGLRT
jgi:hypothetical protein